MAPRIYDRRKSWLPLAGVLMAVVLSGCSGLSFDACPAIGYISTVHVELTGDADHIDDVRMCDAEGACSRPQHERLPATSDPTADSIAPSPVELTKYVSRGAGTSWVFEVLAGHPESVTLTAYRVDGSEAAEMTTELTWRQVGGTAECGGPFEADPIVLVIS